MTSLLQDLRLSLRSLRANPGFTAVAVSALALGIGANTAIFSVVNGVLLQPLGYKEPDRMVRVARKFERQGVGDSVSIPKYMFWKQHNQVFEALTAYDEVGPGMNLGGGDVPEQIKAIHVSADYFQVFAAELVRGRVFGAGEDMPGGPRIAVMSYSLWQRRFGKDPAMIGRAINLNGDPYTVIGVLAEKFRPMPAADILVPLQADPNSTNQGHFLLSAARLKSGVTLASARAQMQVAGDQFRAANPDWMNKDESVAVIPLRDSVVGDTRLPLLVLSGAVGFVLLIACANVANLQLSRAAGRGREIAIRTALGAGRARLLRQLLTESVVLACMGGAAGLLFGAWGLRALLAISPKNISRIDELTAAPWWTLIDVRVLAFTLLVSVATGVLFGLVPALHLSKPDLNSTLKESGSRTSTGRRHIARGALVAGEMALAVVLLTGAALLIRSFAAIRAVDPGFEPRNVLTLQSSLNGSNYSSTARVEILTRQLLERIEGIPGVAAASPAIMVPPENGVDLPFTIEGRALPANDKFHGDVQWRFAGPHYFETLRVPLLRGRSFTPQDTGKSAPVVIISEAMSRKFWPNEDPVGKQITIGRGLGPEFIDPTRQIVGIVGSVRDEGMDQPPSETMYIPYGQVPDGMMKLAVRVLPISWMLRTKADPRSMTTAVQREFLSVDPLLPVAQFRTLEEVISESTARRSFNMRLLTIFAALALLLAAIGIYGVMSYAVEQRRHEMGIRLALGAEASKLVGLVVGQGMKVAGIGVAAGLLASYGLTRFLGALLFGVKAADPLAFTAVAAMLCLVAVCACMLPARRAAAVDPVIALRFD
jgi:putative ABC transport system permease protein